MRFFLAISRGIDAVTTLIGKLMWWVTLFMVLMGVYNVVTRYAFDLIARLFGERTAEVMSGNRYLELQTYSYDLVFLLGAAYVLGANSHVRVDIIFSQMTPKVRAWIDIAGTFLFLFPFCALGIYFSQSYVARSWRQMEISPNPGGLARYPIKTVIIITFGLLIVQGVSELIKNTAFLRGRPDSRSIHQQPEAGLEEHVATQTEAL